MLHLGTGQVHCHRGIRGFEIGPEPLGILGQLVHVDDVREGPEAMQASQQVAPFQSVGEGIEEEQGEATEDEGRCV